MSANPILEVDDLSVQFDTDDGIVRAVDHVSWSVSHGETLGIVGESGSGKSVSAMAIMGLVPRPPGRITSGSIRFHGEDLLTMDKDALRAIRGNRIAMVFQDPLTALNPVFKVGDQIAEVLQVHSKIGKLPAREKAISLLDEVGIPNPRQRAKEYPHQFSGGMRQRAMIAMALAMDPEVLLADEPTTALDVTVQAQIMELLLKLQQERGTAIVLITHDLGVIAAHTDRVLVMYAGRVAEVGSVDSIYYKPRHGYTHGLLSSVARLDEKRSERLAPIPGQPPSLIDLPSGCAFHPRCRFAIDVCRTEQPLLIAQPGGSQLAACHNSETVVTTPVGAS